MFALSGFHAEGVGGRRGPKPGGSRGVPGRELHGKLFNPWDIPAISSSEFIILYSATRMNEEQPELYQTPHHKTIS